MRSNLLLLTANLRIFLTQRSTLHHQRHHLVQRIRRSHGRQLRIRVIRWRHFDNICRHQLDAFEPSDDRPQLTSRPASRLGCTGGWSEGRVESVDVDAEVDWILMTLNIRQSAARRSKSNGRDVPTRS